jgi:hypothetical protein
VVTEADAVDPASLAAVADLTPTAAVLRADPRGTVVETLVAAS